MDRGLIIKEKWANLILAGEKTIEIRGTKATIRGEIGVIISGTGALQGEVTLVDSLQMDRAYYERNRDRHKVGLSWEELLKIYKQPCAWVLTGAKRYDEPIPYKHKQGCVVWVKLNEEGK